MIKLNAKQLREGSQKNISLEYKNEIFIILDNVLDTFNIGSIFRLADAVGARKVYLCGGTETPPNSRIKKASINTTEIVDWEYSEKVQDVIKDLRLKINDIQIVAIELAKGSVPYDTFEYRQPLALIVGNESYGILPSTLKLVDAVVELPMYGINISLNVIVSLAIVVYHAISESK